MNNKYFLVLIFLHIVWNCFYQACRNPDNDVVGPWCYMETSRKEYCPVPICDVTDQLNKIYIKNPGNSYKKTALWEAAFTIQLIMSPLCLTFGTIFNCLSVCVFTRPSLRNSTTSFILICLAIFDSITLYTRSFTRWLFLITGWKLDAYMNTSCQVYWYISYLTGTMSSWLLVLITFERFVAVLKPHKTKTVFNRKNAMIMCVCMMVCIMFLHIPILVGYESHPTFIFDDNNVNFTLIIECKACCVMNNTYIRLMLSLSDALIPFIIILTGNIVIVISLTKAHQKRNTMVSSAKSRRDLSKLITLTKVLLMVTSCYLILTLPYIVFALVGPSLVHIYRSVDDFKSADHLLRVISFFLLNMNNSINFVLYCMGGKRFRQVFLNMCGCNSGNYENDDAGLKHEKMGQIAQVGTSQSRI